MKATWALAVISFLLSSFQPAQSQSPSPTTGLRDSTAVALLQQSVAAMGGSAPADSTATGTITYIAGSLGETGTIQILTRGTGQTLEEIITPHVNRTIVYSQLAASVINGAVTVTPSLETVVTSQNVDFPLPFLYGAYNNPDIALQYVGAETLNGASVQHLRLWDTFNSETSLQNLAPLTTRDIWLDAISNLPVQISYGSWANTYANATIPTLISYSNYQTAGGYAYPSSVATSIAGTPAIIASIQSVRFNSGLTDSNFPVQTQGAAQ